MGGDLTARAPRGVACQPAKPALGGDEHRRERPPRIVERAHIECRDPGESYEIFAVPEAVHVGLAESHAAPQQRAVEAGGVNVQHGSQRALWIGRAQRQPLITLDDRELCVAHVGQGSQHEPRARASSHFI